MPLHDVFVIIIFAELANYAIVAELATVMHHHHNKIKTKSDIQVLLLFLIKCLYKTPLSDKNKAGYLTIIQKWTFLLIYGIPMNEASNLQEPLHLSGPLLKWDNR